MSKRWKEGSEKGKKKRKGIRKEIGPWKGRKEGNEQEGGEKRKKKKKKKKKRE